MGAASQSAPVDGDTLLTAGGVAIVAFLLMGLVVGALAAATAPERGTDIPDAEWSFERINDTHVRITHEGGDPVAARNLLVAVESYERRTAWEGAVDRGDATVVEAASGQVVRVYWIGSGSKVRDQLARWQG